MGVTKQAISRSLKKGQCSANLRQKLEDWQSRKSDLNPDNDTIPAVIPPPTFELVRTRVRSKTMLKEAQRYHGYGWVVVPIEPKLKKPRVRWKEYQSRRPSQKQISEWWTNWPDSGIAVVLGPLSNLLCVDVDGEEPYRILIELLGELPHAPTVKSGSDDPYQMHMYFQQPQEMETGASKTPFNHPNDPAKLELRGDKGILVLPPSLHKSGQRYAWVAGRTPEDVAPPELPDVLLKGLAASGEPVLRDGNGSMEFAGLNVAKSTADFLAGKYAAANGWNNKLFMAACDLHGRGVPLARAELLLLQGAQPQTQDDQRQARDTILSAFSEPREPSRIWLRPVGIEVNQDSPGCRCSQPKLTWLQFRFTVFP